mmetsp:Transcript_42641/g.138299  ORF Transcript_42641/g.138299 Transcript_42641/m.138299 type:complete len:282 (-) Transcript_42641:39-884(-)
MAHLRRRLLDAAVGGWPGARYSVWVVHGAALQLPTTAAERAPGAVRRVQAAGGRGALRRPPGALLDATAARAPRAGERPRPAKGKAFQRGGRADTAGRIPVGGAGARPGRHLRRAARQQGRRLRAPPRLQVPHARAKAPRRRQVSPLRRAPPEPEATTAAGGTATGAGALPGSRRRGRRGQRPRVALPAGPGLGGGVGKAARGDAAVPRGGDDDEPSDPGVAGAALRWPPQRRKEPQAVGCACCGARKGAAAGGVAAEQVAAVHSRPRHSRAGTARKMEGG